VRRFAANTPARLAVFGLLALAAKWVTLGTAGFMNDNRDAQYLSLYEEVARMTVARFHELPFWNPYYCGGLPALGTPSARFVSPTFLLTLALGTVRADALVAMGMAVVGLEGMFRYAHCRGGGAFGSMIVAPVFALSGFFARFPTYGWTHFYGFELVPWALFGTRLALVGSRRGVVLLGLSVAWIVGFGGTYAAPITAVGAGFELVDALVRRARRPRRALRVLGMAGVAVLFAVEASLVRLWPIVEMLSAAPRVLGGADGHSVGAVWAMLFGLGPAWLRGGDYLVGLALVPVFLLGCMRKRSLPLVFAGLLWLWLAHGYDAKPALYAALRLVPPFTMLRAPERFLALFAVVFATVAALGLRRLEAAARRAPRLLWAWLACVALTSFDVAWLVRNDAVQAGYRTMVDTPPVAVRDFHQARGNRWLALYYPMMSRGSLACFDDYNVAQAPDLRADLDEEEYLVDPGAGTVERLAWSPNRIQLSAKLSRPARVHVNQNWHPGWRSSVGAVVSDHGVLAVDLPAGEREVELRFLPRSAVGGGATSVAALGVAAWALWRARGRRRTVGPIDVALFASPLAFALLSFVVVREPRRPPPELVTPAGEPMVADAPPDGALPVDARWAEGITLVASRVVAEPTTSQDERTATVELDWRLDGKPPDGLGVVLYVVGGARSPITFEYALLSRVLLFEDAPRGRILRDVTEPIRLPRADGPTTYQVYVAIDRARRAGERLGNLSGPGADNQVDGSVFAGSFVVP